MCAPGAWVHIEGVYKGSVGLLERVCTCSLLVSARPLVSKPRDPAVQGLHTGHTQLGLHTGAGDLN